MTHVLRAPRIAALWVIALMVAVASAASFAQSYRGLYQWALEHDVRGNWAAFWPLQLDVFIAVGELALFVALVDRWPLRSRAGAWTVTGLGLAASVAGNIGHVTGHAWTVRASAAVPPVAAAVALAVGLGVLKRVVNARDTAPDVAAAPVAVAEPAPVAPKVTRRTTPKASPKVTSKRDEARDIRDRQPDITNATLAKRVGVSVRTLQRWDSDKPEGDSVAELPPHALNGASR